MALILTETFLSYMVFLSVVILFSEELAANTRLATSIASSNLPVSQYAITLRAVEILKGKDVSADSQRGNGKGTHIALLSLRSPS